MMLRSSRLRRVISGATRKNKILLLFFAAACVLSLLRKLRDESEYVVNKPFGHLVGKESLENILSKGLDNEESGPNVNADKIRKIERPEEDGKEVEKEGIELKGRNKVFGQDEHDGEDENKVKAGNEEVGERRNAEEDAVDRIVGKFDGEEAEEDEDEKARISEKERSQKEKEKVDDSFVKDSGEKMEARVGAKEEPNENFGEGDGEKVEGSLVQADEEVEQARIGEKEGTYQEEEEEEEKEGDNTRNIYQKGKSKNKVEVNFQDEFDSPYRAEEIAEKASKIYTEEEEEEEKEEGPLKSQYHTKEQNLPRKKLLENHDSESVFHVNQSDKYPSHEDDRIAYQVMRGEAFDKTITF